MDHIRIKYDYHIFLNIYVIRIKILCQICALRINYLKIIKQPTFMYQLWFHLITQAKIEICLRGIYILPCLTVRDDIWYMDMKQLLFTSNKIQNFKGLKISGRVSLYIDVYLYITENLSSQNWILNVLKCNSRRPLFLTNIP